MASKTPSNPLISDSKTTDSRLQVQLHPLVILTISDYITRHILRQQQGPIVGAILGSQHGRDITMEHAFECKLEKGQGDDVVLDASWFEARLQQFKDVHKAAALDFVGWFTLADPSGPASHHLPIHQQLLSSYNESALLLLFHPPSVASTSESSKGGKLPLSIYESVYETITSDDGDKAMSGNEAQAQRPQHSLRFQELPYTIETGEAEMISMDHVARGGANAAAAEDTPTEITNAPPTPQKDGKGKGKAAQARPAVQAQSNGTDPKSKNSQDVILSPEDADHIASLTTKANAIRMLQQRIALLRSYLQQLPDCYLTLPETETASLHPIPPDLNLDHQILRQISSLLARLPLLTASSHDSSTSSDASLKSRTSYTVEALRQRSDVALTSLLGSLGTTLSTTQKMGRKAAVLESGRNSKENAKGGNGGRGGAFGGLGGPGAFGNMGGGGGGLQSDGFEMEEEDGDCGQGFRDEREDWEGMET